MLVERTFAIGSALCLASAALLGAALVLTGALSVDPFLVATPLLFLVLAGLFLITARQARADRTALLSLAEERSDPGSPERRS